MGETGADQAGELRAPGTVEPRTPLVRQRPPAEGPKVRPRRTRKPRSTPAPRPGWQSLVLRTRHGVDRDCTVLDAGKQQVLHVSSGFFLRSKAEVRRRDRDGERVFVLRGRVLDLPMEIVIRAADGTRAARVRAKWRAPLVSPVKVRLADGTEWETTGSLAKRQYSLVTVDGPVIEVAQKQVQIRDSCRIEVADDVDPVLAAAIVWAIDELLRD